MDAIGNILVTGFSGEPKSGYDIFLSRHIGNGSLDPIFDGGGDGIVITDIGTFLDESHAIALQTNGKIVIGGSLRNDTTGDDFAVLRYLGISTPTAANVMLGGRIANSTGYAVSGVRLILSGGSLTEPRVARTNPAGYYRFLDVPVGDTYIVTPDTGRHTFSPTNLVINLLDEFMEANFTAN